MSARRGLRIAPVAPVGPVVAVMIVALVALAAAGSVAASTARTADVPAAAGDPATVEARESIEARWERFPVFVWFFGGPKPGPAAFEALKRAGLGGCNVEGNDESDAAHGAGLDFYVDHAAGKGDLFLRPAAFDADRERRSQSDLAEFRPARPNCFHDPQVRARLKRLVAESVARHRDHAPLAWVLDDEISVTRGVNPMDYCFGEECLRGLREELRSRYGTIAKLNEAWRASFRTFDEVVPPTTEAARRANAGRPIERVDFTAWSDHRDFMRRGFAAVVGELVAEVGRSGGAGPAGFTGGQFPSAFGGFEGEELVRSCTLVEVYESGVAPELARSFLPPEGKVISTLFVPEKPGPRARWSPWELLARAGRGDDGAVIWSSGAIFEAEGGALNEAGRALAEAVAAARRVKSRIAALEAKPLVAPIALYENAESPRALWLVDASLDGATWPNRLTSHETSHSTSVASREGWAAVLRAASLPWRFVGPSALKSGRLGETGVRCLVLHEAAALSDAEVAALLEFVRGGGLLIGDADAMLFDERLKGREPAALEHLFGVARPAGCTLVQIAEAAARARDGDEPASRGLGTERSVERGATRWLDRHVAMKPRERGDEPIPPQLVQLARELAAVLAERGIAASPRLPFEDAGRAALHRWQIAAERGGGELVVVVATGPARAATSLTFEADVVVERLEPPGEKTRLARGTPLELTVDDRHAFVARWSPAR